MRQQGPELAGAERPTTHPREVDWMLLAVAVLCCLGLVMAVSVQGPVRGETLAIKRQGAKLAVAVLVFLTAAFTPLQWLRRAAAPLLVLGVAGCLAAALFGPTINGARRWLPVGGQPVDFARLGLILAIAARVAAAGSEVRGFRRGFLPAMGMAAVLAAALALQPDMGNAASVLSIAAAMAMVAGVRVRYFVLLGLPLLGILALAAARLDYVRQRLIAFFTSTGCYQVEQSVLAIGSGGVGGRGIGEGVMKLGFVPEAGNDFVFAIVGEEMGFVGGVVVLLAFAGIAACGFRLFGRCADPFARYAIFGFTFAVCMQAALNLCVVTGLVPPKGIDLPYVSSGGTNLAFCMAAIGIIGNAARASCPPPLHPGRK